MSNPDLMQDIIDFHEKFGLTGPPSETFLKFRIDCMLEELEEYELAEELHLKLDALVDLVYFALGTVYAHGLAAVFYEAWRRIHLKNMTKERSPSSEESRRRGCAFDVVKPVGFIPADLSDLVGKK